MPCLPVAEGRENTATGSFKCASLPQLGRTEIKAGKTLYEELCDHYRQKQTIYLRASSALRPSPLARCGLPAQKCRRQSLPMWYQNSAAAIPTHLCLSPSRLERPVVYSLVPHSLFSFNVLLSDNVVLYI